MTLSIFLHLWKHSNLPIIINRSALFLKAFFSLVGLSLLGGDRGVEIDA